MREYYFNVAGFGFSVRLSDSLEVSRLLPSFHPFCCEKGETALFRVTVCAGAEDGRDEKGVLTESSSTDIGRVNIFKTGSGYRVEMNNPDNHSVSVMNMNSDFTESVVCIDERNRYAGNMLSSMIRMLYSQRILSRDAAAIHASSVYKDGKSYLFLGKSGTGKSTHSALWMRYIEGCRLLNDDNPVIRVTDGRVMAYGTPWSGKTPCYKNLSFPVAGIVRLHQAQENRFCLLKDVDAFTALLPSCALLRGESLLADRLYSTLTQVTGLVPVGRLDCRPDKEAALMCYDNINKE